MHAAPIADRMYRGQARLCGALLAPLCLAAAMVSASSDTVAECLAISEGELPAGPIKVLSLNVSHGRGTALNQLLVSTRQTYANLNAVAELLVARSPDIIALQEADAPSRWSGGFDHVTYLAEQAGFGCRTHGVHSQAWLASYGTALLSHGRPIETDSLRFAPSWPAKRKGYVSAAYRWPTANGDVNLRVISVHLDFLRKRTRDGQVSEMIAALSAGDGPLVVMGDFNSTWEEEGSPVRRLSEALALRAYRTAGGDSGTYKRRDGKHFDWILISSHLDYVTHQVLPEVVSDHFAVYAEIRYRGS